MMSELTSNQMKYVAMPSYVSDWCEDYISGDHKKSKMTGAANPENEDQMLLALTKIGSHVVRCHQAEAFHTLQLDCNSEKLFELRAIDTANGCSSSLESNVLSKLSDETLNELKLLVVLGQEDDSELKFETVSDLVVYLLKQIASGSANPRSASREVLNMLGLVASSPLLDADSNDRVLSPELFDKINQCN
jgi:hypothetical protein